MTRIEALIRPYKLEEVVESLKEAGSEDIVATEVRGCGHGEHQHRQYRGVSYTVDFVPWMKIELVADDERALSIADIIQRAAHTGKSGDGKIFLIPTASPHVAYDDAHEVAAAVAFVPQFTPEATPHAAHSASLHH